MTGYGETIFKTVSSKGQMFHKSSIYQNSCGSTIAIASGQCVAAMTDRTIRHSPVHDVFDVLYFFSFIPCPAFCDQFTLN